MQVLLSIARGGKEIKLYYVNKSATLDRPTFQCGFYF